MKKEFISVWDAIKNNQQVVAELMKEKGLTHISFLPYEIDVDMDDDELTEVFINDEDSDDYDLPCVIVDDDNGDLMPVKVVLAKVNEYGEFSFHAYVPDNDEVRYFLDFETSWRSISALYDAIYEKLTK
jgi:hypothetical protein